MLGVRDRGKRFDSSADARRYIGRDPRGYGDRRPVTHRYPLSDHIARTGRLAIICPRLHQFAPLFECIAAPVSALRRIAGRMSKRLLGDLA